MNLREGTRQGGCLDDGYKKRAHSLLENARSFGKTLVWYGKIGQTELDL